MTNQHDFSEQEMLMAQAQTQQTVFTNQVPSNPNASDSGTSYELGMNFRSTSAGQITAIRYWKAPSETGSHVGKIWAATGGTPLATVTFTNETASGWQQQALNTPVNIQANTTYVVSVNSNSYFSLTYDQLATPIVNGVLSSVADGNNGAFGSPNNFPNNSFRNSNYFRDLVFTANGIPTIAKVSGDNQTGTAGTALSNPLVVEVKDASGNAQSAVTVNFAVTSGGGSVSPTSAVTNASGQASTVLTLGTTPGAINPVTNTVSATASSIGSLTFTATANPAGQTNNQTVFTNQAPTNPDATDSTSYELGMKFRSANGGQITGIRFWKAASETGTHIGKIWAATGGIPLATVTFANETASGWQEQLLDAPLTINSGTTYVVSVNANSHFVLSYGGLASSITNGDLSSVADGSNGVYGSINSFPTSSYQNSNYFRDIVFLVASGIVKVSGDNQSATVGTTLPNPLVVKVRASGGNSQSGVTVNFEVTTGGGSVSSTSVLTDANGQASTNLTVGAIPSGPNNAVIVTATAVGIGSVTFSAKASPVNANAIYLENQRSGTTNWKLTNQAINEIAGYATATSVNKGGSIDFKVSVAQAGTPFTIDVYRLGYYGGQGGRLMLSSGTLNGVTQPALTLRDPNTRLYDGSNWTTSYTLAVGSDWVSGLYIAKLTHQSGKQAHIWFVVRHDASTSNILFQSSFTTFLAYNKMSNHSTYGYNSLGGQTASKVSYDVPFAAASNLIATDEFNTMLQYEYNMVRWLESQSYDVSYVTNIDVHTNSQLLQQHKVFLSVGHDEYWSLEERINIEQARDGSQPVNIAFFTANTAFWRVRFENSNSGQPNRVMACYKENWSQDPVAQTNKFRSPQNNKPENALLGVMYTGARSNRFGGYDFVVTNSSDPYYANTNLSNGDTLSMLVGFEWDAVINNGSTPNGLVVLSESPVEPVGADQDLPSGTNYFISNAVRYTAASGAKVFATGSIQWMWGLDSYDIQTPREDIRVKQIAVNVLADMGAKPQTPDANIIVP
ncbi:DUF4082 domain-containing protein [aff. Roholtiella sp. LEGE 12411]|nr:DUF4082 domain-containing protein [aff. Roholtiella sp. LEGE 12411]